MLCVAVLHLNLNGEIPVTWSRIDCFHSRVVMVRQVVNELEGLKGVEPFVETD